MMEDYEAVVQLLQCGANVDTPVQEDGGRTALQWAAEKANLKLYKLLLNAHTNPNGSSAGRSTLNFSPGVTALSAAVSSGNLEVVKLLLASGADILFHGHAKQRTVLEMAISLNNIEMVRFILAQKPAASRDRSIFIATRLKNRELIKLLLKSGVDINKVGYGGINVLSIAVYSDNTDVVKFILDEGTEPNTMLDPGNEFGGDNYDRNDDSDEDDGYKDVTEVFDHAELCEAPFGYRQNTTSPPLVAAISLGNLSMVELLLDSGADYDCPWVKYGDDLDWPPPVPLAAAAQKWDVEIVHRLLKAGANVNSPTSSPTVLQAAVISGNICLVELLISLGAKINALSADKTDPTALQTAVSKGDFHIVKLLLNEGAIASNYQEDIMTWAAEAGSEDILRLLIEKGAAVNSPLGEHLTPLQAAANAGHYEIVKILLEEGADIHAPAVIDWGFTALQGAVKSRSLRMARLLINEGADVAAPGSQEGSALEIAAKLGQLDMLKLLLLEKPKITGIWRVQFENAMKIATSRGHDAAAKFLKYHQVC
jgi:ankyrin repeat protein